MATSNAFPLIAVDIGNSRIKLGEFEPPRAEALPHPLRALTLGLDWTPQELERHLPNDPASYAWTIASVNRPAANRLLEWLKEHQVSRVHLLKYDEMPLKIDVPRPDQVGVDRLANAVAANCLRGASQPAVVIDLGSAITVDLISSSGSFSGGAILPGMAMSARALHEFTDLLPMVEVDEPPDALGISTISAVRSGLYWGTVGGVREVVARLTEGPLAAQIFVTGGDAPRFTTLLTSHDENPPQYVPHLTLAGIALAVLSGKTQKG